MRGVLDLEKMLEREKDEEEDDLGVYFCRSKYIGVRMVSRFNNVPTHML